MLLRGLARAIPKFASRQGLTATPFTAQSLRSAGYRSDAESISPTRLRVAKILSLAMPTLGLGMLGYGFMFPDPDPLLHGFRTEKEPESAVGGDKQTITNWSATHEVSPRAYWQPETEEEVEEIIQECHEEGRRVRVLGSGLSPNGIGFSGDGMLSMALLDKLLEVDKEKMQVRVQAGCRVQQVADELRQHGLTLQNYASIREQQIGGFTQVGAHGTGATIPPVDEQVVALKLLTPGKGVLHVTKDSDPELFNMARLGLGALGVVTEVVLQCVPSHQLLEETFVASSKEIRKNHGKWLRDFQHLRYMWIPDTDDVVVVRSNPVNDASELSKAEAPPSFTEEERLKPLRDLLQQKTGASTSDIADLSATQLRDALLAEGSLDREWVRAINQAEAQYWRKSSGYRSGYSDSILGFDCGGQQWVLEVSFPVGKLSAMSGWWPKYRDLDYMAELLRIIEREKIAAPAPIEQRWTSGSSSAMSPAGGSGREEVFSWVGVIMYLPEEDEEARAKVTEAFQRYGAIVQQRMMPKYNAMWHWAKLEPPKEAGALANLRARLAERYPVEKFNEYRKQLDPKNILANDFIDAVFPLA